MNNTEQIETTSTSESVRAPVAWKIAMLTDASKTVTIIFPQAPAANAVESKQMENESVK